MSGKARPKPDDPAQYKRFLEAAREAEADQTEEGADSAFRKIARPISRAASDEPHRGGHSPKRKGHA
jgi:hypothetical protein